MDSGGHEEIGKIGVDLLKEALKKGACTAKGDASEFRCDAFLLGNWLTDISQIVDTRLYREVHSYAKSIVDYIASFAKSAIDKCYALIKAKDEGFLKRYYNKIINWVIDDNKVKEYKATIDKYNTDIMKQFDTLLLGSGGSDAQTSNLAKALSYVAEYIGYFRYVYTKPGRKPEETAIDENSYYYVVKNHFTQYFPYEHQDRPSSNDKYDFRPSEWKMNEFDKSQPDSDNSDCYQYLRENCLVNAAKIAFFDKNFGSYAFNPNKSGFLNHEGKRIEKLADDDPEFNLYLADLGKALHSMEDFFAHTIFVDFLSDRNTRIDDYRRKFPQYSTILAKRKKKWTTEYKSSDDNWEKMEQENNIISGYFDKIDTVVSLLQKVTSLLNVPEMNNTIGDKVQWTVDKVRNTMEYDYKKLLTDTILLIESPEQEWEKGKDSPDDDDKNAAAELVKQSEDLKKLIEGDKESRCAVVIDHVLASKEFEFIPQKIKDDFKFGVQLLIRAGAAISLYKSIVALIKIICNPLAWLKDFLPAQVIEMLESMIVNAVYRYIGSERVGSHSLIAKDNETDLFYDAAMECAKSVHYQAIHVLTRHLRPEPISIGMKKTNALRVHNWIDWLHFTEYFNDNPFNQRNSSTSQQQVETSESRQIVTVEGDTFQSLADQFRVDFIPDPVTKQPSMFTWRTIAEANFVFDESLDDDMMQRRINQEMEFNGWGILDEVSGIYKFNAGVTLTIPNMRTGKTVTKFSPGVEKPWWEDVINNKDHWVVFYRYGEKGQLVSSDDGNEAAPHNYRMLPMSEEKLDELIQNGRSMQQKLEDQYKKG
jgi:hypothetical protein